MQELSDDARELVGAALLEILEADGPEVCGTRRIAPMAGGVISSALLELDVGASPKKRLAAFIDADL